MPLDTAGVSHHAVLTRVKGGLLELGEGLPLDGDAVHEVAVDVVLVALALLVADLVLEPFGGNRGQDLHHREHDEGDLP